MQIEKILVGFVEGQKEVYLFRIVNGTGSSIEVINYGATIVSVVVPDRNGIPGNVVLRYDTVEEYQQDPFYIGTTVGRVANRISKARFTLNGRTYYLDKNDGQNSNHGGNQGFNKRLFDDRIEDDKVIFSLISKEGEGGFPGEVNLSVSYSFSDMNELTIEYSAVSDQMTPVNFTNHTYFDLSGGNKGSWNDLLQVNARNYAEADNEFLPTGRVLPIAGSAFDFTTYRSIKEIASLKKDNLEGYNAYYFKEEEKNEAGLLASLKNQNSGRMVDVYSSMPGVLFYTGDFLSGKFQPFEGVCLEAQYAPDSMNRPEFATNMLQPGEIKKDSIKYCFHSE